MSPLGDWYHKRLNNHIMVITGIFLSFLFQQAFKILKLFVAHFALEKKPFLQNHFRTMLKVDQDCWPNPNRTTLLDSFSGQKLSRKRITQYLNKSEDFKGVFQHYAKRPDWVKDSLNTKFQLAPPGVGFDCFRSIETFTMGIVSQTVFACLGHMIWDPE